MRVGALAAAVGVILLGPQTHPTVQAGDGRAFGAQAGVTVIPPAGQRGDFHADSSVYVTNFDVTNTTGAQETFTFTCLSSSNASCVGLSQPSFTLTPGNSVTIQVSWNALSIGGNANQSGFIRLAAEGNNNSFGQGTQNVLLWQKAPRIFTIAPILAQLSPNPISASQPNTASFQVRNVGTTTESIFATCLTSASVFCSSHSLPGTPIAPFAPAVTDNVSFATTATATGQFLENQIRTSGGTLVATGRYTFDVVRNPGIVPSVTPDGGPALPRQANTTQTVPFTVTNTGTQSASYNLSVVGCSGSAFPSPSTCVVTSPSNGITGVLAPNGGTIPVTVSFNTLAVGTSGTITLRARHSIDTTIFDTGFSDVTIVAPQRQVAVTALTPSQTEITNQSGRTTVFRVQNAGTLTATYNIGVSCTPGTVLFACTPSPSQVVNLGSGGQQNVTVTFSTGGTPNTGQIVLTATDAADPAVLGSATTNVTVVSAGPVSLLTMPKGAQRSTVGAQPDTAVFTVKNVGQSGGVANFAASCPSGLFTAACVPHIASASIAPNESTFVRVPLFTAPMGTGPDTGTVRLIASSGSVADTGTIRLTRVSSQALVVSVDSTHAGVTVARDVCLSLALPSDATAECGHLRLWHPLPSTRALTTLRVPTMLYSSAHAHPFPTIPMDVLLPAGAVKPDSVELRTRVNGTVRRTARYVGGDLVAGVARRAVAGYDASADSTGIYNYSLEFTSFYGTSRVDATPVTGQLAVVNRGNSTYGAGWWLAGLELLIVQPDSSRLWIGGDGSTRRFAKVASNTYVAPSLDFPDTLLWDPPNNRYERRERGGVRVRYNAQGNHTATVNRLGHTTSFTYIAGGSNPRLDRLTIPVPSGGPAVQYLFAYTGTTLTTVEAPWIAPVSRVVAINISPSNQLLSITDPDTSIVRFGYDPNFFRRIASRTDRRNVVTTFVFDAAHSLSLGILTMESPKPPIIINVRGIAMQGFGVFNGAVNRLPDTSLVYVLHDGPRPLGDAADTTRFYLDRYGAPKRIVDALNNTTRLTRADTRFPTLVTSLQRANGHVLNATYDARGNLSRSIDVGGNIPGSVDTTTYVWHQTWDALSSVKTPRDSVITFGIDAANGNRLFQKYFFTGMQFDFTYHAGTGLIATTKSPVVSRRDSIFYDALGNLARTKTPKGYISEWFSDAIGRDTLTTSPIDTTATASRISTRTTYDIVSQVRSTQTSAPATTYTLVSAPASTRPVVAETVTVVRNYDREGNVTTIQTLPSGDSVDVNSLESFAYDNAGRVLTRQRGSGPVQFTYDQAGNPIVQRYRGSFDVTERYDALNRRIERIVPERLYASELCGGFPASPISGSGAGCLMRFPYYPNDPSGGLRIAADTSTFGYDAVGNLTRADNADARVRRQYTLNGQVSLDSLAVRSYATSSFTSTVFVTRYGYDRNGRRQWMRVPSQIAVGDSMTYTYDANGLPRIVRDPAGRRHNLGYDLGRRPDSYDAGPPSGGLPIHEGYVYDDDDRLIRRTRTATGIPGFVSADTLTYDARGKLLRVRRLTRVQNVGAERVDLAYSGLGALVAMDRRFGGNQWQIEEYRADPLGHTYWNQTKSFADGPQLEQRSLFALQTGALTSRAAIFPQNPTGSTLYPDEVTAATEPSGAVVRASELQRNFNSGTYTHFAATRTYLSADGQTRVVQRYLGRNQTQLDGTYEEYRYDALGRRVLLRTRKPNTPPAPGATGLCNTTCTGAISRWVWDGAQLLGETRAPGQDGLNSGQLDQLFGSPPHYGVVGYVHHHSGGWDEPLALMDGRVFNRNWRGLPESSQLFNGTAPDCSMGLNPGTCITVAWPTDVGPYFRRPVPAAQGSIVPTWLGSLAANGATGSGRLYRRFREYDPATGQFTHEDPIGLAGGANLYGYANGDPVNFGDPLGLCAVAGAAGSIAMGAALAAATGGEYGLGSATFDAVTGALCVGAIVKGIKLWRASRVAARAAGASVAVADRVIGHYPEYLQVGDAIRAKTFDIPTAVWQKMSPAQRWAANKKFLDRGIARGAEFVLATRRSEIREGTMLAREVDYLLQNGYQWATNGLSLIKK